jgi:transcriptional regulator with XRE-family HTH domain
VNSGKHFGQLLRAWRTERSLTQQQVAITLGWDKPKVNRLELGQRRELTLEEALHLCSLMGVDIGDAVSAVDVPEFYTAESDWLGQQIAANNGLPYSVVRESAISIYGRDASAEHFARCSYSEHERDSRAYAVARGNRVRRITREVLYVVTAAD